jgi:NAD(P)H-dependent FMN reductase
MSASPGGLGGIRGLVFLRMLLGNIGITVLPDQQAIPQAHQAFDHDDNLKNQQQHQAVSNLGTKLTQMLMQHS